MNTRYLIGLKQSNYAAARAATKACNGVDDWFLPSKDELNEVFRALSHSRKGLNLTPLGQFERGYYWTSSNYNGSTAWTQYFADGQQFDRVQTLSRNKKPPMRPFLVRPMRAFSEGVPRDFPNASIMISGKSVVYSGIRYVEVSGKVVGRAPGTPVEIEIYSSRKDSGYAEVRDDGTFFARVAVGFIERFFAVIVHADNLIDMLHFST